MAKERANGANGRLEEAITGLVQARAALVQAQAGLGQAQAVLVQNQAAFLAQARETDARIAEMERTNSERFGRIEALLLEHNRMLLALPDAVREKIGFKPE
jgi:hypothetical protein